MEKRQRQSKVDAADAMEEACRRCVKDGVDPQVINHIRRQIPCLRGQMLEDGVLGSCDSSDEEAGFTCNNKKGNGTKGKGKERNKKKTKRARDKSGKHPVGKLEKEGEREREGGKG